jgi:hypothetical protein
LVLFFYRLSFSKQASNDLLRRMLLSAFFFKASLQRSASPYAFIGFLFQSKPPTICFAVCFYRLSFGKDDAKVVVSCEMSDHKIVGGCSTLLAKVNKK